MKCNVCENILSDPLIPLPNLPFTETYVKIPEPAKVADQTFYFCEKCSHGQLGVQIDPTVLYGTSYSFRTSKSSTARGATHYFINFLNQFNTDKEQVIDIGCNDLYLLKQLNIKEKIGIDPILKEIDVDLEGIIIFPDLSENIDLGQLIKKNSLVISRHTLEHIVNPKKFFQQILEASHDDTTFVFEFPCLDVLVANNRFDQIFHQHQQYFTLDSIEYLLNSLGADIIDYKINYNHWGALIVAFEKSRPAKKFRCKFNREDILNKYILFKDQMDLTAEMIAQEEKICGYGASLMLPVIAYHLNSDLNNLTRIYDDDFNKHGCFYPGLKPVISHSCDLKDYVILVTAIDTAGSILKKLLVNKPRKIINILNIII